MDANAMSRAEQQRMKVLRGVNHIFIKCGLDKRTNVVSTGIFSRPEAAHIISDRDLRVLAANAVTVFTDDKVDCNREALTHVLWGIMRFAEEKVDGVNVDKVFSAATPAGAAAATPSTAPAINNMTKLYYALNPILLRSHNAAVLLRTQEDLIRGRKVTSKVRVMSQDVDLCVRLVRKMNGIFKELATPPGAASSAATAAVSSYFSVRRQMYSVAGHRLFRILDQCISCVTALLTTVVSRPGTDVHAVVRLLNSEDLWETSGYGVVGTASFCNAVQQLGTVLLMERRGDFDNAEEVLATLVLRRIAARPPLDADLQALLFYRADDAGFARLRQARLRASGPAALPRTGHAAAWMLMNLHVVQRALESFLTLFPDLSPAEVAATQKLRHSVGRQLQVRDDDSVARPRRPYSFYELIVVAAVEGMPEADLTDDAALVARARETAVSAEPEILQPSFLVLLLAAAYATNTSGGLVSHAPLADASVLRVYDAVAEHYFQQPLLTAGTPPPQPVNQLFADAGAGLGRFITLLINSGLQGSVVSSPDDMLTAQAAKPAAASLPPPPPAAAAPSSSSLSSAAAAAGDPQQDTGGTVVNRSAPHVEPHIVRPLCVALLRRIDTTVCEALFRAVQHYDERGGGRNSGGRESSAVPDAVRAIALTAVTQLFRLFRLKEFVRSVGKTAALRVMAHLYAIRIYFPISPLATEADKRAATRLIAAMQKQLMSVVFLMRVDRVNGVLVDTILPLSNAVATKGLRAVPRLQQGLFEAYLRAFASTAAGFAAREDLVLEHWINIAMTVLARPLNMGLAIAAHDFFIAPLMASRPLSLLFVPTYVAVFIRGHGGSRRYPVPPLALVQHFSRCSRVVCQGIEKCDDAAVTTFVEAHPELIARVFGEATPASASTSGKGGSAPASSSSSGVVSEDARAAMAKLTPTSAILLVVSALFDELCYLWSERPRDAKEAQKRFLAYFTSLANLLQCTNTSVLHRVCASIEAIVVEHLRGSGQVQLLFLEQVGKVVDRVRGASKKGVAEWYLKLNERVRTEAKLYAKL